MNKSDKYNNLHIKINSLLKNRYAIEKINDFGKNLIIFLVLTLFQSMLFVFNWSYNRNLDQLFVYIFVIVFMGIIMGFLWKSVAHILPRFVWIGVLGWFLLSSEMVTNLLVPGSWQSDNGVVSNESIGENYEEKTYIIPAEKLIGFSYKQLKDEQLEHSLYNIPLCIFKIHKNNEHAISIIILLFLFIIILFYLLFITSLYKKHKLEIEHNSKGNNTNKIPWYTRERVSFLFFIIMLFICLLLFIFTLNYFILITIIGFISNFYIFKLQIGKTGINHKTITRTILFTFVAYVFTLNIGFVYFNIYLPIFKLLGGHNVNIDNFHISVIIWVIIAGSAIALFIGIVTQFIWEGSRLTSDINE